MLAEEDEVVAALQLVEASAAERSGEPGLYRDFRVPENPFAFRRCELETCVALGNDHRGVVVCKERLRW